MHYHVGIFGQPGASKSTIGLSFPGVEQHVFGSSEEFTANNFPERKASGDILPPLKWDWMEFLSEEEKAKLFSAKDEDYDKILPQMQQLGTARKIRKYRRYILQLKSDILTGKRPELKSVFLDNGTPFMAQYRDWFDITQGHRFITEKGNYDSIKASIAFNDEMSSFVEEFNSLPCNTVMSFHVQMAVDQETAAKVDFMNDSKKGIKYAKEFQPMITGSFKYHIAGKFDFAFFVSAEENPGQNNKYIAKLEADSANVGIAKGRIQPFDKASRIELPKGTFFDLLDGAVKKKLAGNQVGK